MVDTDSTQTSIDEIWLEEHDISQVSTRIVIDDMALTQELIVHKSHIRTCKYLFDFCVRSVDNKSRDYS